MLAGAGAKHFIYLPWPRGGAAHSWAVAATTLLIIWFARILEASDLSERRQLLGSAHVDLLGTSLGLCQKMLQMFHADTTLLLLLLG